MNDDTKICPFCAEEIKKAAILCKHCKSKLDDSVVHEPSTSNETSIKESTVKEKNDHIKINGKGNHKDNLYLLAFVGLICVAINLIFSWVYISTALFVLTGILTLWPNKQAIYKCKKCGEQGFANKYEDVATCENCNSKHNITWVKDIPFKSAFTRNFKIVLVSITIILAATSFNKYQSSETSEDKTTKNVEQNKNEELPELSEELQEEKVIDNSKELVALKEFNDVPKLLRELSQVGIGEMTEWQYDEYEKFFSLTNYFVIGNSINNIAIYARSNNRDYIELLNIHLNVNTRTPQLEKDAIKVFNLVTDKVFKIINKEYTDLMAYDVKTKQDFTVELEDCIIKFKFDSSRIDAYDLVIETKPTK